ncbi:MAG: response regulator [Okeania sp. SIO2C9]|uniref:response regulator n=1 Tax=Okeania sp. SIO2C9 TaxID=2607791 RepID=UPI0013C0A9AF|nr:response regulator [Okeania sp. SIO2C9]NEQ75027.1 response regulator [Okeania sp. SIO2C9]
MSAPTIGYIKLANTLSIVSKKQVTGKLSVAHGNQEWQLYFLFGHLLYASGGLHPTRRWYRAVKKHCPNFKFEVNQLTNVQLWEYKLLQTAISDNQITLSEAKAILRTITEEVFFAIISQAGLTRRWHPQKHSTSQTTLNLLLSRREIKEVLASAKILLKSLQDKGLWQINPDLVPIIKNRNKLFNQEKSESVLKIDKLLNGERTIWDITLEMKMSLEVITRSLYSFEKLGLIDFLKVEDWLPPSERFNLPAIEKSVDKVKIACIDDSYSTGFLLGKILQPLGYEILHIQNPIKGLALLEECKPDLIFLDLIMPKVSGYTVCEFLRKTTTFQDIPIVFFSTQDSIIDRTRARIVGANDYLCKSYDPEKIVEVVEKYVNPKHSTNDSKSTLGQTYNFTFMAVGS